LAGKGEVLEEKSEMNRGILFGKIAGLMKSDRESCIGVFL
jgi:hypothetical protein